MDISLFYLISLAAIIIFVTVLIYLNTYYKNQILVESVNYLNARGIKSHPLTHKIQRIYMKKDMIIGDLFFFMGFILFLLGFFSYDLIPMIFGAAIMILALVYLILIFYEKKQDLINERYLSIMDWTDIPNKKIHDYYPNGNLSAAVRTLLKEEEELKLGEIEVLRKIDRILLTQKSSEDVEPFGKAVSEEANLSSLKLLEVIHVLKKIDTLLEQLPKEDIERFRKSEDYQIYSRVMSSIKR